MRRHTLTRRELATVGPPAPRPRPEAALLLVLLERLRRNLPAAKFESAHRRLRALVGRFTRPQE